MGVGKVLVKAGNEAYERHCRGSQNEALTQTHRLRPFCLLPRLSYFPPACQPSRARFGRSSILRSLLHARPQNPPPLASRASTRLDFSPSHLFSTGRLVTFVALFHLRPRLRHILHHSPTRRLDECSTSPALPLPCPPHGLEVQQGRPEAPVSVEDEPSSPFHLPHCEAHPQRQQGRKQDHRPCRHRHRRRAVPHRPQAHRRCPPLHPLGP